MSQQLAFILGGARSGKSRFAETLAAQLGQRVLYVATAQIKDEEMRTRVLAHRQARPPTWRTIEASIAVGAAVRTAITAEPASIVLLDCLTLLISNLILQGLTEEELADVNVSIDEAAAQARVAAELDELLGAFRSGDAHWIVVSNEVGWGLVPPYPLGRVYRDVLGWANQRLAAAADQVYLMVAGIPVDVKALGAKEHG
jgi:adenosylcobinamide kinase/adenosylcobinamide-phosphate guanylyltransferase